MDDLHPGGLREETLLVTKHAIGPFLEVVIVVVVFVFLVVAVVAAAADAVVALGVAVVVVDDVDDDVHVTLISVLSPPTVTMSNIT